MKCTQCRGLGYGNNGIDDCWKCKGSGEIVEEVCIWEYNKSSEDLESTCGKSLDPSRDISMGIFESFVLCPYCGKPIKNNKV